MTLSSATNEWEYPANGVTTVFAYTTKIHAASHLVVSVVSAGVVSTKVLNTDYTVSGAGSANGGNVTFTTAPANGTTVVIQRTVPLTQTTDLKNQGDFYPETHENAFDRLMMAIQQVNRLALTSLRIPVGLDDFDAGGVKITDLGDGEDATDAATKGQLDDAVTAMQSGMAGGTVASYATGTGNGSSVYLSFPGITVSTASAYVVAVGGVIQRPETDYTVDVANERIVFSTAPGNGVATLAICYGYKRSVTDVDALNVTYQPAGTGAVQSSVRTKLRESVSVKDFGAVGDGVTDDSAAIQAADYYLYKTFGGGNLIFPVGDYLIRNSIFKRSCVNWIGETSAGYFAASYRAVRIIRHTSLATMIYHAGSLYEIRNIEFEGNSGDASVTATQIFALPPAGTALPADDPLRPGITTYQNGSGLWLDQCTLSNCWYAITDNSNFGAVNMRGCTVRQFLIGVVNTSDSRYIDNIFVGCTFAGMSQNVGGIHITGNLFEFNRQNDDEAAYGIFIQNNASEIQIDNNRFDRNAGQDIYITSGTKRPHTISINGNHFMRAAWGTDVTVRTSLYIANADNVVINGNIFYAASSFPSTVQGLISPRAAIAHSGCTALVITSNSYNRLAREISLTDNAVSPGIFNMWPNWVQSGSGTGEWYLTSTHDADLNPWIGEPSYVVNEGALMTAGTAGSLSAGQWDWADNDSLGFSTVYARITGDTDPGLGDIVAYYDADPVISQLNSTSFSTRSTDYQDDEWVDVYLNRAHPGRTLVANNATAAISSNVLSITVPDGHGIEAGDWLFLDDAVTVSVPDGAYQVLSVTDAGGGNDYINVSRTAANASGTIDIYTVTAETFTLRTRRRVLIASGANEFGSLSHKLTVTAHGISPAYRNFSEWPFTIVRSSSSALPAIVNGTIVAHNSNLSHNWYATSSNENMSISISSDILGDKLSVTVINTTAYDIAYQIGIRR